jgi:hypothetical protein
MNWTTTSRRKKNLSAGNPNQPALHALLVGNSEEKAAAGNLGFVAERKKTRVSSWRPEEPSRGVKPAGNREITGQHKSFALKRMSTTRSPNCWQAKWITGRETDARQDSRERTMSDVQTSAKGKQQG